MESNDNTWVVIGPSIVMFILFIIIVYIIAVRTRRRKLGRLYQQNKLARAGTETDVEMDDLERAPRTMPTITSESVSENASETAAARSTSRPKKAKGAPKKSRGTHKKSSSSTSRSATAYAVPIAATQFGTANANGSTQPPADHNDTAQRDAKFGVLATTSQQNPAPTLPFVSIPVITFKQEYVKPEPQPSNKTHPQRPFLTSTDTGIPIYGTLAPVPSAMSMPALAPRFYITQNVTHSVVPRGSMTPKQKVGLAFGVLGGTAFLALLLARIITAYGYRYRRESKTEKPDESQLSPPAQIWQPGPVFGTEALRGIAMRSPARFIARTEGEKEAPPAYGKIYDTRGNAWTLEQFKPDYSFPQAVLSNTDRNAEDTEAIENSATTLPPPATANLERKRG